MDKKEKESLIDIETRRSVDLMDGQFYEDQLTTIKNLIYKFVHLDTAAFKLRKHDLINIISTAKQSMANERLPMFIDNKDTPVNPEEARLIFIIQATISYLNGKDCFKKQPIINYNGKEVDDEKR